MNIPQVNALATDRNREQTKRLCSLLGKDCAYLGRPWRVVRGSHEKGNYQHINLPNGSFTLCQIVAMLEELGWIWFWQARPFPDSGWINTKKLAAIIKAPYTDDNVFRAPSLTAAMDVLIKVLETKGEKS